VGDWRSAWRFALAGMLAGFLVVATSQTAVVAPLFFGLQDQLFPAPEPSSQVTLVALDSTAARPFGPYPALGDTVNTAARFCGAAPAFNLLVGWTTFQACSDFIAVDEMPGLQLKGKSAETFRLFNVTAIREEKTSPWVQFPTAAAMASYAEYRRPKAQSPVAATTQDGA
jgi:hypothetical protein